MVASWRNVATARSSRWPTERSSPWAFVSSGRRKPAEQPDATRARGTHARGADARRGGEREGGEPRPRPWGYPVVDERAPEAVAHGAGRPRERLRRPRASNRGTRSTRRRPHR